MHLDRARWSASAVTAAAMIATPLVRRGCRAGLSNAVIGGLSLTTLSTAMSRWGGARAVIALATTAGATTVVEKVGTTTGVPFGRYGYTSALRPQVAGVPVAVPLAWFAMALPARETAHAVLGHRSTRAGRVLLGAACLTAWDLFLDPQMTAEGYWAWSSPGRYRGIPAVNFLGWFVTGLGVMAMLEAALPPGPAPDAGAVLIYAWMAVMQTLGFALFFRDPVVALAGGAAMVPLALAAARQVVARG